MHLWRVLAGFVLIQLHDSFTKYVVYVFSQPHQSRFPLDGLYKLYIMYNTAKLTGQWCRPLVGYVRPWSQIKIDVPGFNIFFDRQTVGTKYRRHVFCHAEWKPWAPVGVGKGEVTWFFLAGMSDHPRHPSLLKHVLSAHPYRGLSSWVLSFSSV